MCADDASHKVMFPFEVALIVCVLQRLKGSETAVSAASCQVSCCVRGYSRLKSATGPLRGRGGFDGVVVMGCFS